MKKRAWLVLAILGVVFLTACAGSPASEPVPEVTEDPPPDTPAPVEIPVSELPAPEPEPTPADPSPQDAETETPPPESETPAAEPEPSVPSAPAVGYQAPDFMLLNPDGNVSSLCDLDRPMVLNFWNTGCKPCRTEMPYLQDIYDEKRDEGLFVLAINIGQDPSSVKDFMEDNKLTLTVAFDTNASLARAYQIQYIPTTFFVDAECIIQEKVVGSFRSKNAIEEKLAVIMPDDLE
jgi:peroxiredoxin